MSAAPARILSEVPDSTLEWLLAEDNPAVAVLARHALLGETHDGGEAAALWAHRNSYAPVAAILDAERSDGTWDTPSRDYQKYRGSLWQVHFLGELWADSADERVQWAAEYAFSRQMPDGAWSCNNKPAAEIPCLTANVARALARLGWARDERIVRALEYMVDVHRRFGPVSCSEWRSNYTLNGYCHMLAPKLLLFLAEVPRELWPDGAEDVRDAAVCALRDKQVFRCLPNGSREFMESVFTARRDEVAETREAWLAEHPITTYGEKPGWLRFGFPLSYNSDALEALDALLGVGEPMREEYQAAVDLVRSKADPLMRWKLANSFNGKMHADVETKGQPSRWLTLRALRVLEWAAG